MHEAEDIQLKMGKWGSNVEKNMAEINIAYDYLPEHIEGEIPDIISRTVIPIVQEVIKSGHAEAIFGDDFRERLEYWKNASTKDFIKSLKSTYQKKIDLQSTFRDINKNLIAYNIPREKYTDYLQFLLISNKNVEQEYFALSYLIKHKANDEILKLFNKYKSFLGDEDLQLVLSQAIPSFYARFNIDIQKYRIGLLSKSTLIESYFNNSSLYFGNYISRFEGTEVFKKIRIDEIEENLNIWRIKKTYLMLERKIPEIEIIDTLLLFDNVIDKYLQTKNCFAHDIISILLSHTTTEELCQIRNHSMKIETFEYLIQKSLRHNFLK